MKYFHIFQWLCILLFVMNIQQTLILLKPDAVQRGLIGTIISRFEQVGLKMTAIKMVHPRKEDVDQHYALTDEWMRGVFEKSKAKYDANGEAFPWTDHVAYGTEIKRGLMDFLMAAPIVAMVW
mgnify:CR=1 FL=1